MAILEIVTPESNEGVLRTPADKVANIKDPAFQTLIDNMIETMRSAEGVGLAAPQIGQPYRLAVIETLPKYDDDDNPIEGSRDLYVIVNPEIIWTSRKMITGIEGCLSLPGYLGEVERNFAVTVRCEDRHGRRKRFRLKGWDARIFQHEIDHLDGVMYTDRLTAPEKYWTEDAYEEYRKQRDTVTEE